MQTPTYPTPAQEASARYHAGHGAVEPCAFVLTQSAGWLPVVETVERVGGHAPESVFTVWHAGHPLLSGYSGAALARLCIEGRAVSASGLAHFRRLATQHAERSALAPVRDLDSAEVAVRS
jgi:hypothetical protein